MGTQLEAADTLRVEKELLRCFFLRTNEVQVHCQNIIDTHFDESSTFTRICAVPNQKSTSDVILGCRQHMRYIRMAAVRTVLQRARRTVLQKLLIHQKNLENHNKGGTAYRHLSVATAADEQLAVFSANGKTFATVLARRVQGSI